MPEPAVTAYIWCEFGAMLILGNVGRGSRLTFGVEGEFIGTRQGLVVLIVVFETGGIESHTMTIIARRLDRT